MIWSPPKQLIVKIHFQLSFYSFSALCILRQIVKGVIGQAERSRWLDIGQVIFCVFMDWDVVSEFTVLTWHLLDWTSLYNIKYVYLQSNNNPGCTVHVFLKNADGSQPILTLVMQARNRIICCLSYTIYMYMYMDCFHNHFLIPGREIQHGALCSCSSWASPFLAHVPASRQL